ncbi:MAG: XRE family transcriptional regulator [Leifsonia sp.]
MSPDATPTRTSSVLARLGDTVRTLRVGRGLTMEQLSTAAGVSRRVISQLEHGASNPSLSTLDRIAGALGTDFASLMLQPKEDSLSLAAAEDSTLAWTSPNGSSARILQSTQHHPPAEMWRWALAPGDEYVAEPDPPGSHELFLVLEGILTIVIAGEGETRIPADHSARLSSDREYSYRNDEETPLSFIRVVQLANA